MAEIGDAFLARANESLAGATSELANERFNNAANRSYYACFHAAISALARAGIRPPGERGQWTHAMVQSQFTGTLINRRKAYPAELQDMLLHLMRVRIVADYDRAPVTKTQATRAVRRAHAFVTRIAGDEGGHG